jgi:hypothetical protein
MATDDTPVTQPMRKLVEDGGVAMPAVGRVTAKRVAYRSGFHDGFVAAWIILLVVLVAVVL